MDSFDFAVISLLEWQPSTTNKEAIHSNIYPTIVKKARSKKISRRKLWLLVPINSSSTNKTASYRTGGGCSCYIKLSRQFPAQTMARGLVLYPYNEATSHLIRTTSVFSSVLSRAGCRKILPFASTGFRVSSSVAASFVCLMCSYSSLQKVPIDKDMLKYREAFAKRMSMAGLKPHHRIAMGVSGGPDSMALCVLAADWKTNGLNAAKESVELIDGLLAIVVDHGLRVESKDEANTVRNRVLNMGIRCEIVHSEWSNGRPKLGHIQEAARDMRYQLLQKICFQHQIGVLLIAHHADDQAELFILRLSRNSGVLGLAGMALTSQLFTICPNFHDRASDNHGILLVRPLLEFLKEDMYMICQLDGREWVEDPTNQNSLFARNRIRISLDKFSPEFKSELQAVISACRRTRLLADKKCRSLMDKTVSIMAQGYAVVDLEVLNPSEIEDICLSKFVTLLVQFISQRHMPVRGCALKLLLNYIRTFPCKTSCTAANCYLCPAPGSKGSRLLVCCSVNSSFPYKMELLEECSHGQFCSTSNEIEQIVASGTAYLHQVVEDASDVHVIDAASTESVLIESKRLGIISESTYRSILSLRDDEIKKFMLKTEAFEKKESKNKVLSDNVTLGEGFYPGKICYFMNRFFITLEINREIPDKVYDLFQANCAWNLKMENQHYYCSSCLVGHDMVAKVRCMVDADWLCLAELCKSCTIENSQQKISTMTVGLETSKSGCSDYVRLSAQRALLLLKTIPVAARRGLPVLVNSQGLLLSIPNVGFQHCPWLAASAVFKPRIPLGGGHSSFI